MEYLHDFAQSHAVALSAGILIIAYIFIASEKISKVAVVLIGACAAIFLGLVSEDKLMGNGAANPAYYVNYIDFNVIFLPISMMIIVSIAEGSGIFNYAAAKMLALTRGRLVLILPALAFFTAFVSAFLDNVTTVILVMPMTFAIAEKLEISPVPFLITEVFFSNIGGTATLIGDPPNIIIGSAAGLSFMDFVRELAPIVALIMAAACAFLLFAFRKSLRAPKEKMDELMRSGGGAGAITDRACAMRSITVLSLVVIGFMLHDAIGFQTSTITLTGAAAVLTYLAVFREFEPLLLVPIAFAHCWRTSRPKACSTSPPEPIAPAQGTATTVFVSEGDKVFVPRVVKHLPKSISDMVKRANAPRAEAQKDVEEYFKFLEDITGSASREDTLKKAKVRISWR